MSSTCATCLKTPAMAIRKVIIDVVGYTRCALSRMTRTTGTTHTRRWVQTTVMHEWWFVHHVPVIVVRVSLPQYLTNWSSQLQRSKTTMKVGHPCIRATYRYMATLSSVSREAHCPREVGHCRNTYSLAGPCVSKAKK
jgi:hypothetical protein